MSRQPPIAISPAKALARLLTKPTRNSAIVIIIFKNISRNLAVA